MKFNIFPLIFHEMKENNIEITLIYNFRICVTRDWNQSCNILAISVAETKTPKQYRIHYCSRFTISAIYNGFPKLSKNDVNLTVTMNCELWISIQIFEKNIPNFYKSYYSWTVTNSNISKVNVHLTAAMKYFSFIQQ